MRITNVEIKNKIISDSVDIFKAANDQARLKVRKRVSERERGYFSGNENNFTKWMDECIKEEEYKMYTYIFYKHKKRKRINRSFPMCPERYKLTQSAVFSADYSLH